MLLTACVGLLLMTSGEIVARSVDTDGRARPRSGIDIRVTELMIQAMRARDAGDMNSAALFWLQARAHRPSLRRPPWLDEVPVEEPRMPVLSDEEFVRRVRQLPYSEARVLLNDRLLNDPSNLKLRRLFLEMAEEERDSAEISRHGSIVDIHRRTNRDILVFMVYVLLGVLLIWQVVALVKDLQSRS